MNIGILTFHIANNYGAVLQAYALQEALEKLGHNVEIVDYRNKSIEERQNYFSFRNIYVIQYIYRIMNMRVLRKKMNIFQSFRQDYLNVSKEKYYNGDTPSAKYDILIVGSDQVWSPNITGGIDPIYWGEFAGGTPIITYAASAGNLSLLPDSEKNIIRTYVHNFKSISVREFALQEFLKTECNVIAPVVVDPTLLVSKEIFEGICAPRVVNEPYLLVYNAENSPKLRETAFEIANKKGLKIVKIGLPTFKEKRQWPNSIVILPTVPQLLSLFKYADYVVSLSFHGTVFSILFEKEFVALQSWNMARVQTLLDSLNLTERIVNNGEVQHLSKIDYSMVKKLIAPLKNKSLSFLLNNI